VAVDASIHDLVLGSVVAPALLNAHGQYAWWGKSPLALGAKDMGDR